MVGFLLQWSTSVTLLMFPLLLYVYRGLALREERDVRAEFGAACDAGETPRFLPRVGELHKSANRDPAAGVEPRAREVVP